MRVHTAPNTPSNVMHVYEYFQLFITASEVEEIVKKINLEEYRNCVLGSVEFDSEIKEVSCEGIGCSECPSFGHNFKAIYNAAINRLKEDEQD